MRYKTKAFMNGQAMTETLITASTVLVPMLLLIPLLGKYIDIKHTTIQAARYEAWEYTVWYGNNSVKTLTNPNGERPYGYNATGQPVKSPTALQNESRRRFFSDYNADGFAIAEDDYTSGYKSVDDNPMWRDHRGNKLWDEKTTDGDTPGTNRKTPDLTGGVANVVLDIFDAVFGALAAALSITGSDVGFTVINTNGLATATVEANVSPDTNLTPTLSGPLDFQTSAAVLTDQWNAGGLEHTTNQAGGLVPTKILGTLLEQLHIQDAIDIIATFLAPELRGCNAWPTIPETLDPGQDGSLWLGYVNIDAVHPDRLESGGSHGCPDGICVFEPEATYSPCFQ